MTITGELHPLFGQRLAVEGWRHIEGVVHLVVRLPDGSPGTVEVSQTSAAEREREEEWGAATVLSVEGIRRLRSLLGARLHDPGPERT